MNFENIKELINIINNSSFTSFELKQKGFYIKVDKQKESVFSEKRRSKTEINTDNSVKFEGKVIPNDIDAPITIIPEDKVEIKEGVIVSSPLVGTFYSSPSPENPPFVKEGDTVKEGDILCIIEAMKIMNEIKSQYSGKVAETLVKDGDMVEYSQPLFRII